MMSKCGSSLLIIALSSAAGKRSGRRLVESLDMGTTDDLISGTDFMSSTDVESYLCNSHDECPESTFCYDGECDLCEECHYCHDGIDGTCGSCGDGYPVYESNCVTTDTVMINGMPCSLLNVVYVPGSKCINGSSHYDSEGDVCANDGQWNEAYCSYELGDSAVSACAYCSPNGTDWKFEDDMSSTGVESWPCNSHDECPESTFCYDGECDLCEECHYCHDGVDGTCGSCGDGYPLYESNCSTTAQPVVSTTGADDTVTINGMLCSLSNAVYVSDSECTSGSPHYDSEGDVCANDGQWNEAYCSYELGDSACAYCSANGTELTNDSSTGDYLLDSRYVVSDELMDWSDGNDYCSEQYGSSLATITNDEDAQILFNLTTNTGIVAWTGMHIWNGSWQWASGYPCDDDCSTLDYWYKWEPASTSAWLGGGCAKIGYAKHSWIPVAVDNLMVDNGCDYTHVGDNNMYRVVCDFIETEDAMSSTDVESWPCSSHDECPESTFCYHGECDHCGECHYCHDGVDGTCGSCGDGYPLYESNCVTTDPEESSDDTLDLSTTHDFIFSTDVESYLCTSHDECPESTFCYNGECDLCEECHYCHDGVDGTCGSCGGGYPLYESNCETTEPTMELSLGAGDYVLDSRYAVSNKSMAWSEGNDYCSEQYGTSLATITSDEDAQILFNLTTNTGVVAWTGMYVVDEEWKWVSNYPCDNDDCSSLEYWYKWEPASTSAWLGGGCAKIGYAKHSWIPVAVDNLMVDNGCEYSSVGDNNMYQVVCDLMTWSSAPTTAPTDVLVEETQTTETEVTESGALQLNILMTLTLVVIGGFVQM